MASQQGNKSADLWEMVQSIGDAAIRKQTMLAHITMLSQTDGAEAARLLDAVELTDSERRQYELMLNNAGYGY